MSVEPSFSLICPDKSVAFLVGLGLGLLSFLFQKGIELRKANREDFNNVIDKSESLIGELINSSCAYWARAYEAADALQEQKIKNDVMRVGKYISDLHKMKSNFDISKANNKLKNFSQLMTNGDFETKKRKSDPSRCGHIRDVGMRFEAYLTSNKIKKSFFN